MKPRNSTAPKVALALSGGGPLGAIYEIGALCALDESLLGLDFNRLEHYVGVSAGGFIAWHDGPIFYATSGTNAVGGAKKLIPMFVLKKEVKIKPRMGAGSLFQSQLPNLERLVAIEAQGGWG